MAHKIIQFLSKVALMNVLHTASHYNKFILTCLQRSTSDHSVTPELDLYDSSCGFVLRPPDRPQPPDGKPEVTDLSGDSCRLVWQPPTDEGGCPVTSYIIERREMDKKDGRWRRVTTSSFTHAVVPRLRENVVYRFRVLAENSVGLSDAGRESDDVTVRQQQTDINYDSLGKSWGEVVGVGQGEGRVFVLEYEVRPCSN